MSAMQYHGAELDRDTRYELAKLRILTDRAVNHIYRTRGFSVATALDPEVVYLLDLQDAILNLYNEEECLA